MPAVKRKRLTPLQKLRKEYNFWKRRHNKTEMARLEEEIKIRQEKEKTYRENRKYNQMIAEASKGVESEISYLPTNDEEDAQFKEDAKKNGVDFEEIERNPGVYAEILKSSLIDFITVFYQYSTHQKFSVQPFHNEICKKLEDIVFERNTKKNLYIGVPPRHGKSTMSYLFLAWCYTHNKNCNFILTSCNEKLSKQFSANIKSIIETPLYKKLFGIYLDPDNSSKDIWQVDGGGLFRACTLKGAVIGFGAGTLEGFGGALIIDDFMKASDAGSEIIKSDVVRLYQDSLKTRLNNHEKTPIIILAQRLDCDDLVGWIKKNEPDEWDFLEIPALRDNETAIWPQRISVNVLIRMREREPQKFWAQYQQSPKPRGGSVIKGEWFKYYSLQEQLSFRRVFLTADTAFKTNQWNDYSAFGIWGSMHTREFNRLYLLDMEHGKFEAADLSLVVRRFIARYANRYGPLKALYIEDKASGIQLIQDLKRELHIPVIGIKVLADKYTRVCEATPRIMAGDIWLPEGPENPISRKLISECEAFCADMTHKHDDMVDMMAHAIKCGFIQRGLW